ncbi:MAG: ribosome-associated translation inhibitor RaiA [Verrucomicrobiota bacterium]
MEIHLSARHLKLTGAIRAYVTDKLSVLENITDDIIGVHTVILYDENNSPAKQFQVKVHLGVPGPDIHIEQYGKDLYEVVDKVEDKLARQLRKRKTKRQVKKRSNLRKRAEEKKRKGLAIA